MVVGIQLSWKLDYNLEEFVLMVSWALFHFYLKTNV